VCVWYGGLYNLESCGGLASVVLQDAGQGASSLLLLWCTIHSSIDCVPCGGVLWEALDMFRTL